MIQVKSKKQRQKRSFQFQNSLTHIIDNPTILFITVGRKEIRRRVYYSNYYINKIYLYVFLMLRYIKIYFIYIAVYIHIK